MTRVLLPTRALLVSLAFVVGPGSSGCAGRRNGSLDGARALALAEADLLFKQRADPEAFQAALRAYLKLEGKTERDPRVLWRLGRAFALRGYRTGGDAGHIDLRTGRDYALQCLLLDSDFGSVVQASGGVVTPDAIEGLTTSSLPCLAWATLPWARLLHEQGPAGSAIDLEALEAMGAKLLELGGEDFGAGRALHARGLTQALRPRAFGGDLESARTSLRRAAELAPHRLTPQVDLAEYALLPAGDTLGAERVLQAVMTATTDTDNPDQPENLRAQDRAASLLRELGAG